MRFLQENSCHEGQGFLFSRPLTAADLENCLVEGALESFSQQVRPLAAVSQ